MMKLEVLIHKQRNSINWVLLLAFLSLDSKCHSQQIRL